MKTPYLFPKKLFNIIIFLTLSGGVSSLLFADPPKGKNWKLVFYDDFNYPNEQLDDAWISQNGASGHILCSRWRENAVVENGNLKLVNKKEKRGGQEYTSGSIWTKKSFRYGYFECRYKYSKATFSNNSFWLIQTGKVSEGKKFEIDINEGHYPDEININLHNWSDFWTDENGKKRHGAKGMNFCLSTGMQNKSIALDVPVRASKIRLSTTSIPAIINEIRVFPKISESYPSPDCNEDALPLDLENYAFGAPLKIFQEGKEVSGNNSGFEKINDGNPKTSYSSWKNLTVEMDLGELKDIGCIQIFSGKLREEIGEYQLFLRDYVLEIFDGKSWTEISSVKYGSDTKVDLSETFHVYALEWDEENLIYYFDGKEIFRQKNEFCFSPSPVYLSLALGKWCGPVIDESVDGSFMEVDYVKVWQDEDLKTSILNDYKKPQAAKKPMQKQPDNVQKKIEKVDSPKPDSKNSEAASTSEDNSKPKKRNFFKNL